MHTRLENILADISPADHSFKTQAENRSNTLIMPPRAMGALLDIAEQLCSIQRTLTPSIARKGVLVLAGDHGIATAGVSAYPQELTVQMIGAFLGGFAGINTLADHAGADILVADIGVNADLTDLATAHPDTFKIRKVAMGTENFAEGPAMTRDQATTAILTGYDLASEMFASGIDTLATGEMGIGNTTPSAAIGAVLTGQDLDIMVGRGTCIDDHALKNKRELIARGIEVNAPNPADGLDVLAKVGGYEIGGIAGMILAAAHHRKLVVVDGFISTAGALIAQALCPVSTQYMISGHASAEPGHKAMVKKLGLSPVLQLDLRLGEGTGAVLAMNIIEGAISVFTGMKTWDDLK
ncbi:MAG TPA: nicotinate-nucleotide--dimethylbenzimidazole phosphoribosyltransferase [Desulfomicrobiaceae bacterium]|nr:nicotinate-nucleotide--dimethylbenzimidazole phosphoribosyltransferase [Desulfomicrobiaceae bacterium]